MTDHWIYSFTWQEVLLAAGILILFLVFRKLFTIYIFRLILTLSRKAPTDLVTNILLAFERPVRSFFVFIGFYLALIYLPFPAEFDALFLRVFRTLVIVHIAWGLFNLSASTSTVFSKVGRKLDIEFDQILLPFLSKLVRFALIAMALSIIADEWGYNVSGFVAGLGLGGLAFALAAQDSIGNFFGGVIIITEKPFTLGDWIQTPSVEGVVEDISFRSTKIRTFADSVIVVPNSTLANEPIENWAKMKKRQISYSLNVEYGTSRDKLRICVERIDKMLRSRKDIDQELIIVRFNDFNESSLGIFLYLFTVTTQWEEYMKVREDVNLEIMKILEEEGVSVAFPSRSVYMANDKVIEEQKGSL
ncbi:mechanosensitive ion channel family protein [Salipaludibacillus sp. CUR1]|uniref:mechanosensitive ion channel family protein n=1 Tax=Salipaludibacillus sp. CUR1 TaxID=2820003 RepID=UPI001E3C5D17|nr:mechanosensitive ion channel family protein [Salipaludibacillus sp. CUR1]MCE7794776.1 mechanosensitive ion channel family protein [Salipaludibacillus sp. CUR1]